jgi:hypothetical protein
VDYAREQLLDLYEYNLNEPLGVGGSPSDTDIVRYCASLVGCTLNGASNGSPIDWNNDGNATETNATADIDNNGSASNNLLTGNDWEIANGVFTNLNFNFQCTTAFAQDSDAGAGELVQSAIATNELGRRRARELHILYPPAAVSLVFNPARSNPSLKPPAPGMMQVALLGSSTFDVNQVELSSLNLHGAHPVNISVQDINNDGVPDLLLGFRSAEVRMSPRATHARLVGWLKNSRSFVGEAQLSR